MSPPGTEWDYMVQAMNAKPSAVSRFKGCLIGGAVGDALGAPVEFMSLAEIRRKFGSEGITGYSPVYGRIGAITDDTQMTLWTAEGLLRYHCRGQHRGVSHMPSMVHRAYLRWLITQGAFSRDEAFQYVNDQDYPGWMIGIRDLHARRAPGNTCLAALKSAGMGTMDEPKNDSKGCGGVMRVAPAGLYEPHPVRAFKIGCEIAALTHGHPTGYLASGCLAAIVASLTQGKDLRAAVDESMFLLAEDPRGQETVDCVNRALSLIDKGADPIPETVESVGQGWIAEEALAISIYCSLAHQDDFRKAVLLAVNHSGDSDSTGAITGNILGTLLGVKAIPLEWISPLELRDEIATLAEDLHTKFRDDDEWFSKYPGG